MLTVGRITHRPLDMDNQQAQDHRELTARMHIYDLSPHIFTGEGYFMGLDVLFLLKYLNTFDNEAEGNIIMYSFIEYIWYDLKDMDVNN